jgi:caffeoyl-CoA O-methyltransferase
MTRHRIEIDDRLQDYILANSLREPEVLRRLRQETAGLPGAGMQIGPEQGQFMALLVELIGARRTLEIGTFTGYSALVVALALPPEGRVVACDVSEEFTAVARRYWAEAGVADKIELHLAPALETLDRLLAPGPAAGQAEGSQAASFDFAFIDADKANYGAYYERALRLLRPGGLIAIDNVLWSGKVADKAASDPDTRAIQALNAALKDDSRVTLSLLPLGDGLTLAIKR